MKHSSRILIISNDAVVAALLGLFAELAEMSPQFAQPGERPEDALTRVSPLYVALLDGTLDVVRSDLFFAQAARARVGIAIFHPPGASPELAESARRRGVPIREVPTTLGEFRRMVDQADTSVWWRMGGDRRAPANVGEARVAPDGTLIYVDATGRSFRVFDRRGSDRRGGDRRVASDADAAEEGPPERLFIADDGATYRYLLAHDDAAQMSAEALSFQLARAELA